MAGLIETFTETGLTLYAMVRNEAGQVWNGSSFEAWNASNWATYAIAMTEQTSSGVYSVAVPAGINTAQRLSIVVYNQLGGSPAAGDEKYWQERSEWNGSSWGMDNLPVDVTKIDGSATAAQLLSISARVMISGAAQTGTLSVSQMTTDLSYTIANLLAGRVLIFTTGDLAGRAAVIAGYAVSGGRITFATPLPQAPVNGDEFIIL